MGCSRPGALAVACVTLAGVLSSLSLFLPYWSKLAVSIADTSDRLELTFGIWGSCLTAQAAATTASSSHANSSTARYSAAQDPVTNFTCASYFDTQVVGLKCTDFSGITGGDYSCKRVENDAGKSLCASATPLTLLFRDADSTDRRAKLEWLRVVKSACGGYGRASVGIACVAAALTGLTFVLLSLGITCGPIESCVAKAGSWAAVATACLQSLLALFWFLEARPAADAVFGTSYYMNAISVALFVVGFLAARSHSQLGQEAQKMLEVDFAMEIADETPQIRGGDVSKNAVGPAPTNLRVIAV
ncbi:hypothetical protein PybrP1_003119 [[Pythium] brassicae (nom. inval.)]|nr:hypothetical protein PybrP1_003119 [[Pythium] brassicae (nom. inval.)]